MCSLFVLRPLIFILYSPPQLPHEPRRAFCPVISQHCQEEVFMWRKQEEPKTSSAPREANAGPVAVSRNEPPSPAVPVITPVITKIPPALTPVAAALPEP